MNQLTLFNYVFLNLVIKLRNLLVSQYDIHRYCQQKISIFLFQYIKDHIDILYQITFFIIIDFNLNNL